MIAMFAAMVLSVAANAEVAVVAVLAVALNWSKVILPD